MSRAASSSAEFYTLQVGPHGGFAVRGLNDQHVVSLHVTQREAIAAAKRLNLEGHATSPVELPVPVISGATQRAEKDGVSVAEWIASAVEDRIRNEELADRIFGRVAEGGNARDILDLIGSADAEYFRARAARASGRSLGEILDQGRDNPPDPGGEL